METTNESAVTAKVNEFTEAVAAANGSVVVIGIMPGREENGQCLIAAVRGNHGQLAGAVAKLFGSDEGKPISSILRDGMIAALHKIVGGERLTKQ